MKPKRRPRPDDDYELVNGIFRRKGETPSSDVQRVDFQVKVLGFQPPAK